MLSIVNLGRNDARLSIQHPESGRPVQCKDLLKGIPADSNLLIKPYEVLFLEVITAEK